MGLKVLAIVVLVLINLNFGEKCQVKNMMDQILAEELFDLHRDSVDKYFLYQNEYSRGCDSITFGNKILKLTYDTTGRVFIIRDIQYDSLKYKAEMKIFLPSDNMLITGDFTSVENKWKLENLTYIEN
ncbi:hypothetical protein PBT90_20320 [Algoriphagus halophytocola]|uniref:Uncharacterized protein n=1 Tax=Algoriphagus halophytocola TaxID=2991499 RepID=A0ABY6MEL7_9BACT|nr:MULTISPECIES: hypothetical protein [unclassified Algoriphagus]UZD21859.1 hypothetical protein OM944_14425 [Algoriphagus sp. TR-M5]WBL43075.1 hypothetical protein PBT90_20320 [Algoriphagus sp. TR-M9]